MKRRAFTLLELVVVMAMTMILIFTIGAAFKLALDFAERTPERLNRAGNAVQYRQTLESLFEGAYVSSSDDDALTYFVASSAGGQAANPDTVTFVTLTRPVVGGALLEQDNDFETLNERYGPQGGPTEVALSTFPVGDAGNRQGLFLRMQTPADGDPTQGGRERLLVDGVVSATYEFWDGTQWLTSWDTRIGQRRLPAAIRITLEFDDGDPEVLTLRLPLSDVTALNPIVQESGGGQNP